MNTIQNSFLEVPLQNALALYNQEVLPRLTKKNKIIGISAAVAISLVYFIKEKVMKPPKNLRHIPYINFISLVKSIFRGDSINTRTYDLYLPELDKPGSRGLYTVRST